MKLWLDDRRPAPPGWARAYTVADAQRYLSAGPVEEASLDHDLGACDACLGGMSTRERLESHDCDMPTCEHVGTGYALCLWMEQTGHWPKKMPVVHSMNGAGAARMREVIQRHYRGATD